MYWLLQRQLGGLGIEVIIDRRERERRSPSRGGVRLERRRGDRRVHRLDDRLREFGWAVVGAGVATAAMEGERCLVCGTAILPHEGRYRPPDGVFHMACYEAGKPAI